MLPSLPHARRNQRWGCRRGKWAYLLLTLPATLKCGGGEPPPLFRREAQRGQVPSPKLCRTARTRTQNTRLPTVRAAAVVLQCPHWVEGVTFSRGSRRENHRFPPTREHHKSPTLPCPQIPLHHLSGYLISWPAHCSLGKDYVPLRTGILCTLLDKGTHAPNGTRAD